jgi:hypothetical protein
VLFFFYKNREEEGKIDPAWELSLLGGRRIKGKCIEG